MATPILMPRQGQSVESCIIGEWFKKKGDSVKAGDLLFSYETDKASFEEEAKQDGVILEVYFEAGDDVPCLTPVAVIGQPGEKVEDVAAASAPAASTEEASPEKAAQTEKPSVAAASVPSSAAASANGAPVSPRAKNLAEKAGVNVAEAIPTGPNGRIIERDITSLIDQGRVYTPGALKAAGEVSVESGTGLGGKISVHDLTPGAAAVTAPATQSPTAAAGKAQEAPAYTDVKHTTIRKVIAKNMMLSLSNTAQLTLNTSYDASALMAYRKTLKDGGDKLGLAGITLNDMIVYAVSRVLLNHPYLNAHYLDEGTRLFKKAHVAVAVDTDRGLMVPTLFDASEKTLLQVSQEVKTLASECQAGTISPDKMKNASFTISNLGTFGVESFTPVINPPQTGILGVGTITQKVRENKGQLTSYPSMGLSLTFDHRALDGAPAARFLQDLKTWLENFPMLLAK